jgi:hypothetical protein
MHRYPFAVGEEVYCCWEHDLPERNERFLKTLDGEFFSHIVERNVDQLEGESRQRAAVALRVGYHHGAETLFSLLGALAQAPEAVPAWLPKCPTPTLRGLVQSVARGDMLLTQRGRQAVTFSALSAVVHQFCWQDELPKGATAERFATFWSRLASEFLDERNIAEYNSLKHGFRVAAGGFVLRVGEEPEEGVRAPESSMTTIGASPFGTSFFEPQAVIANGTAKYHFRIRHAALNWRAEAMVQRLQLIAWSINNVIGCLRCLNGSPPNTIRFLRSEDAGIFDAAWQWQVGVRTSNFDLMVDEADVVPASRADLLAELESRSTEEAGDGGQDI